MGSNKNATWVHIRGVVTPGGDPYYECPECGWGRCYGVEHSKPLEETCPNCGATLQIPDEEKHLKGVINHQRNTSDEYREAVLKAIRDYEKRYHRVDQYEICNALGELYEIVRAVGMPK